MFNYTVGDQVWVKCVGTDVWSTGTVIGFTPKRVRVFNDVRGFEGLYSTKNVETKASRS